MDYALLLLFPMLVGFYVGHLIDERTGHGPWFTLAGLIVGMVLGIGSLYKRGLAAQEKLKRQQAEKKEQAE